MSVLLSAGSPAISANSFFILSLSSTTSIFCAMSAFATRRSVRPMETLTCV
jgi:hypothetical protein